MADETIAEPEVTIKRPKNWRSIGIFFSMLGLVIFVCAFAIGFFALAKANRTLSTEVNRLQATISQSNTALESMQSSVSTLQQTSDKFNAQRQQQEEIMNSLQAAKRGDLAEWHVAEAYHLTRMANDLLQFTGNVPSAIVLLERADQTLQSQDNPKFFGLRESLTQAITNLKTVPVIDITGTFLQLSALDNQIESLPMPNAPLQNAPTAQPSAESDESWWQRGLNRTWEGLRHIIIVRETGTQTPPLVLPDEKKFLYQNLHSQMQSAIWGLLNHNAVLYQASLNKVSLWIETYFALDAEPTKVFLQNISTLKNLHVEKPNADLSATLNLFADYFAQVRNGQPTQ